MKKLKLFSFLNLILLLSIYSCQDIPTNPKDEIKEISFYLTDCPFEADEVNIEILLVSVEDKDGAIIDLNTNVGIYNLLEFQDGVDTLIASGNVDFENISNVFLEIGSNNTIVVEGVEHPLELLNPNSNSIKVKVNLDKLLNDDAFIIDFYACTSIVEKPSGYFLKPVIKFKGKKGENNAGGDQEIEDILEKVNQCYDIVYPISFVDSSAMVFVANTDQEVIDIIIQNEIVEIQYPFDIISMDGSIISILGEEDIEFLEDCKNNEPGEEFAIAMEKIFSCYSFEFPVNFIDSSGLEITINDSMEVVDKFNQGVIVDFVYPFTVIKKNGQDFKVSHSNMLNALNGNCDIDSFEEIFDKIEACFEFVYPIELENEVEEIFTVNDKDELNEVLDNESIESIIYPIKLMDEDSNEFNANNENQLDNLLDDC